MKPPIRIAVLECDTPLPNTAAKYGGYGGVFEKLLKSGATASGRLDPEADLEVAKHNVQLDPDDYPKLDDIDAILITGSKFSAFEDEPWIKTLVDFTSRILEHDRIRTIGVCFGHQIVGRALGVKVGRNQYGWEVAVDEVNLSDSGKRVFGKDKLNLQQMHRDIVLSYPEGMEKLGSSHVCSVQGMYEKGQVITVQGHPEFDEEIVTEIVRARHAMGIFSEEGFEEYMDRAGKPHDGVLVGRTFIDFLLDD